VGYDLNTNEHVFKYQVNASLTTVKCCPIGKVFAVGSDKGVVRVFDMAQSTRPRLIQRVKSHADSVKGISFDSTGRYMVSISTDSKVFVYDVQMQFSPLGYIDIAGSINGAAWSVDSDNSGVVCIFLVFLFLLLAAIMSTNFPIIKFT
jgi:WD40 repeat protein